MKRLFLSTLVLFTGVPFAFGNGLVHTKECGIIEMIRDTQPVIRLQDGSSLRLKQENNLNSELTEGQLVCLSGIVDLDIEIIEFCETGEAIQNSDCVGLSKSLF